MNTKQYCAVTSSIFLIIAILHLARLIYGWDAIIGTFVIQKYMSVIALVIAFYLWYQGKKVAK